jgi:hypothetical protein
VQDSTGSSPLHHASHNPANANGFENGEVNKRYTRADAIGDGVRINVPKTASEAGSRRSAASTRAGWGAASACTLTTATQ